MDVGQVIAGVAAVAAVFGSIGATVRWASLQFKQQSTQVEKLEHAYATLFREHSLVLVRIERFRLAFQMVAADLARKSPSSIALVHARALLDESFKVEPDLPEDLKDLLERINDRLADSEARAKDGSGGNYANQ